MVALRTCLLALALVFGAVQPGASETSLLTTIATCTGRLSAVLEHHWLTRDDRAKKTARLHAHMTDLFHALIDDDSDRQARLVRAQSKDAFLALLRRAHRRVPDRMARMAAQRVFVKFRQCTLLVVQTDAFGEATGLYGPQDFMGSGKQQSARPTNPNALHAP